MSTSRTSTASPVAETYTAAWESCSCDATLSFKAELVNVLVAEYDQDFIVDLLWYRAIQLFRLFRTLYYQGHVMTCIWSQNVRYADSDGRIILKEVRPADVESASSYIIATPSRAEELKICWNFARRAYNLADTSYSMEPQTIDDISSSAGMAIFFLTSSLIGYLFTEKPITEDLPLPPSILVTPVPSPSKRPRPSKRSLPRPVEAEGQSKRAKHTGTTSQPILKRTCDGDLAVARPVRRVRWLYGPKVAPKRVRWADEIC